MLIANLSDHDYSMIGKFDGNCVDRSDVIGPTTTVLVNSRFDSNCKRLPH